MSDPAFLADGSGIAPHIPLAKVRKVGLGGETAHVGYFLQRVVCRPQQLPDTFDTDDVTTRRPSSRKPAGNAGGR